MRILSRVRRVLPVLVLTLGFAVRPLTAQGASRAVVARPSRPRPAVTGTERRAVDEALRSLRTGDTLRAIARLTVLDAAGIADARVYLVRADIARARQDLGLARAVLARGRSRLPADRALVRASAYALAFDGDLVRAEQLFDSLVRTHPTDRASALGRAWSLAWRGRLDAAHDAFVQLGGPGRARVDALFGLGWVARAAGDTSGARERFAHVLALDATHGEARAALTTLSRTPVPGRDATPPRDTARPPVPRAVPDLPHVDDGWQALARGDTATALTWFRAQRTAPTASVASLRTLGVLARTMRQYPLAEQAFLAARARDPMDRTTAMELAVLYGWTDRWDAADALYADVLRRAPEDRDAHLGRARLAYWAHHFSFARQEVQRVLAGAPDQGEALLLLGDIERAAWHLAAARAAYQHAARDRQPALRATATDRLDQLTYDRRGELVLMGGATHTLHPWRGTDADLLASLQWQWNAAWQSSMGVAVNALGDVRTVTLPTDPTATAAARTAWAGLRWTPPHPLALSTTAYLRTADSTQTMAWWMDGAVSLGPVVRVMVGAHLREMAPRAVGGASWIVSTLAGVAIQGPARHSVSILAVAAPPRSGEPVWTTTLRLDGAPVPALQYGVAVNQAREVARAFTSIEGSTTLFPVPTLGIRLAGLSRTGTFARRAVWGGLVVRF